MATILYHFDRFVIVASKAGILNDTSKRISSGVCGEKQNRYLKAKHDLFQTTFFLMPQPNQ